MSDLLLSICVTTYNRPKLLARVLRSVIVDSPDVEIIVTDNSADDLSEQMVQTVLGDAPCKWRYNRNNFPASKPTFELIGLSLNKAVSMARGRYIYVIQDDDFVRSGGISMLLDDLKTRASAHPVIKYANQLVDLSGRVTRTESRRQSRLLSPRQALREVISDSSFSRIPSLVFRRDVYEKVGYWSTEIAGPIDLDMYIRVFRKFGLAEFPEVLGCYTIHDEAQTTGLFSQKIVLLCLQLCEYSDPEHLLSTEELRKSQAMFIHQFILGGAYRGLRKLRFREARAVMDLFNLEQVRRLKIPIKWAVVRMAFALVTSFSKAMPSPALQSK